jgi:hypothetical protein
MLLVLIEVREFGSDGKLAESSLVVGAVLAG